MLIDKLSIPIGLDMRPLSGDVGKASAKLDRFASAAAPVVPVSFEVDERDLTKHLKSVAKAAGEHFVVDAAVKKLAPAAAKVSNPVSLGMAGVDATAGKVADVTIGVSQSALKAGLSAATATVKAAVSVMAKAAVIPLTVAHVGMSIGFGVAQALLLKKIKEMTGWSNVRLIVTYAGVKVGLAIASRLVKAAVGAMAKVATFPIRLSLTALRVSLRMAKSLVVGTMNQIKAAARAASAAFFGAFGGGLGLGVLGGIVGVPAAIFGSVKAASDLGETISKVKFAFNDAAKVIIDDSDEMAARFGVPRREFMDGATGIGLLGKAAGLADAPAAKLGSQFARLAADLSSLQNLSFDESLQKIRSGLAGEAEPLRAVGVLLSEQAVKSKAAAMGLAGLKDELTEGQKVMARAALISEGLKVAQGDLARTADGLANRMRELWGRIQNVGETIGQFLLPAAESLARTLNEMATGAGDALRRNAGTLKQWGDSLKAAADQVGVLYRNFTLFKSLGGSLFTDLKDNLAAIGKALFTNLINYGTYFSKVLGQQVEKAIITALHAAFEGTRFDPGKYEQRVHYLAPKLVTPQLGLSDQTRGTLGRINAAEGLRAVGEKAKAAAPAILDLTTKLLGLQNLPKIVDPALEAMKRKADEFRAAAMRPLPGATDRPAAVAMRGTDKARALAGFASAPARLAGALGGIGAAAAEAAVGAVDKVKGKAKAGGGAAAKLTPLDVMRTMAPFNAALGGALGGIGGGGPAAALGGMVAGALPALLAEAVAKAESGPVKLAGLAEMGSREAASAVARHQANAGGKGVESEVKRSNRFLERIAKASEQKPANKPAAVPVFSFG